MDIAYLPMARGFVHLAAVPDWFSRKLLAWQVSITLEAEFCIEVLEEALARHGRPEILNADQGSQFTSLDCIQVPKDAGQRDCGSTGRVADDGLSGVGNKRLRLLVVTADDRCATVLR